MDEMKILLILGAVIIFCIVWGVITLLMSSWICGSNADIGFICWICLYVSGIVLILVGDSIRIRYQEAVSECDRRERYQASIRERESRGN